MIIHNLNEKPEAYSQVIRSIEESFGYQAPNKFDIDFYPLMEQRNWANCYLLYDGGQLIGHIGTLPEVIGPPGSELDVIFIGGINILKSYQGQGYFDFFFKEVLKILNTKHFSLAMLWSDKVELYQKYGFYLSLGVNRHEKQSNPESKSFFEKTKLNRVNQTELLQLKNCFDHLSKQVLLVHRDLSDWNSLKKIDSSDLYIGRSKKGISAYFFKNKGQDLKDIVHEFGFRDEEGRVALKEELKNHQVWVPEGLELLESSPTLEFSSFTKILDLKTFTQWLSSFTEKQLKLEVKTPGEVHVTHKGETFKLSEKELLISFLGPGKIQEIEQAMPPVFIPGLSSI